MTIMVGCDKFECHGKQLNINCHEQGTTLTCFNCHDTMFFPNITQLNKTGGE